LAEILYQEAVDIFCRFIPDKNSRTLIAQEIPVTLNISKDQAAFSTIHKPATSLKSSGLQVGRVFLLLSSLGETSVGQTTSIQFPGEKTGRKLKLINMNQPSDSADLRELFTSFFFDTFSTLDNSKFLVHLGICFRDIDWSDAIQLMSHSLMVGQAMVIKTDQKLVMRWKEVRGNIKTGQEMVKRTDLTTVTVIAFTEGTLTEDVKKGDWKLMDEVNMAPAAVLDCLSQLLDSEGSITLNKAMDYKRIPRHKYYRTNGKNPVTDTGKVDLRNRFPELHCNKMADIIMMVTDYLGNPSLQAKQISSIATFYAQVGTYNRPNI
jgi:midasin